MKRRFLLAMPLVAFLVGCGGGSLPSRAINLNEDVVVSLGETVLLRGEGTTVQIESVLEDSRCPVNADCVQAGQVRVSIKVVSGAGTFTQETKFPLLPTETPPPPASGYYIALLGVTPDRFAGVSIPLAEYRFTIRVSKVG
ncbi:MAG: hypothetical protein QM758_21570 [Armatimonas sp.]